jgi:hypothetical protein
MQQDLCRTLCGTWGSPSLERQKVSLQAERLWLSQEAHFRRRIAVAAFVAAAAMVLTWITAKFGLRPLAILGAISILGSLCWMIYLIIEIRRTFRRVMTDDGLTGKEAAREFLRRYGG